MIHRSFCFATTPSVNAVIMLWCANGKSEVANIVDFTRQCASAGSFSMGIYIFTSAGYKYDIYISTIIIWLYANSVGTFTLGSPVRNKTVLKQRLLGELKRHNKLNYESESRHQHSFCNCASKLATKRDWGGQTSFLGIKSGGNRNKYRARKTKFAFICYGL